MRKFAPHGAARTIPYAKRLGKLGACGALAAVVIAGCTSAPRYRSAPPAMPAADTYTQASVPAPADSNRQNIIQFARTFLGTPYRNGGMTRSGVDCSGLVMAVYREFDIDLPRTSLDQSLVGAPVARAELQPADLVFFKTSQRNPVTHVGIYMGGGRFIHASTSARRVRVDKMGTDYFRRRYVTARRVLDD